MSKVKQQKWLPKSWVCGRIIIPICGHDLNGFAKLHTRGNQVRFPVNLAEEETVAETDIIMHRLLAV